MFVGYEDSLRTGSIGDAVRIFDRSSLCDGLESFHIDYGAFVLPSGRCIDSAQLRNRPNAVNVREAVEICHNFAFLRIENNELIGVHVCDIKTAMGGVETLVVEARGGAGQRHVRNLLQWCGLLVVGRGRECSVSEYRYQYR